ncbi:MAG TPA: hypothetical protein EYP88_00275 [Anaerolineales bacterium]|nr:hypothetical protein [Anaerolineales bacterium]
MEHFKSVLRRRRYDWGWHTTALQAALESIRPALAEKISLLGMVGEAEPGFIAAALMAANQAGFTLEDFSLNETEKQVHLHWEMGTLPLSAEQHNIQDLESALRDAARAHLLGRGEPCGYLPLNTAMLTASAKRNLFPNADSPAEGYSQLRQAIRSALKFQYGFLRFGGSEKSLDVGLWWLIDDKAAATPLADRVEIAVVRYLLRNPGCTLDDIETALKADFSGAMYPPRALVAACLGSYGEYDGAGWYIRAQDHPSRRRAELVSMGRVISGLGKKLHFHVHPPKDETQPIIWQDALGNPLYAFYISASALLGKFLLRQAPEPVRGILVIPGGRANLTMFKLRRDPRLQKIADKNWGFVKYRQIRQMQKNAMLTPATFEDQLALDPLTYDDEQLRLL